MNSIQFSTSIRGGERWRKQLISNCFLICWKLDIISSFLLQQTPQMSNFMSCGMAARDLPRLKEKQDRNRDPCSIWFLHKHSISSPWTPPSSQPLTGSRCPTPVSSSLTPLPAQRDPRGAGTSAMHPAQAPGSLGHSCSTKHSGFKLFIYLSLNLWSLQMPFKWQNLFLYHLRLRNRERLSRAQNASGTS